MRLPSDDQLPARLTPSAIRRRASDPSAFMIQTCGIPPAPASSRANRMRVPSGDQAGNQLGVDPCVMALLLRPAESAKVIWLIPPASQAENAIDSSELGATGPGPELLQPPHTAAVISTRTRFMVMECTLFRDAFCLFQKLYAPHKLTPCLARFACVVASQAKNFHEVTNHLWVNALRFRIRDATNKVVKRTVVQKGKPPVLLVVLYRLKHLTDKLRLLFFGRAVCRRRCITNLSKGK